MSRRTEVEINWFEKDNRPKLEPRTLRRTGHIDRRREQFIADIEGKLQQAIIRETLFFIRRKLV
jgi:hypothetical protein